MSLSFVLYNVETVFTRNEPRPSTADTKQTVLSLGRGLPPEDLAHTALQSLSLRNGPVNRLWG